MLTHNPKQLREVGDTLTWRAGRILITLQWIRPGAYGVTTYQGTLRIDEHCKSWPTEDDARAHAFMLAAHYQQPDNYVWPCGCGDTGWIDLGNGATAPCAGCNPDKPAR